MKIPRDQFEKLASEQLDTLYRLALRLSGRVSEAEDLVQETYFRALRSHDSFDLQETGIRPWLVRILRNLFLTRVQREARQPASREQDILEATPDRPPANVAGPWSAALAQGMDEELVQAIEHLPEQYRTVMLLWALEDFSYQEIAEAMEIPIGTVMSRLHRARARLATRLQEYARSKGISRE
jgi:RNA polymerase sigma-70 factor (ECF subfamily)